MATPRHRTAAGTSYFVTTKCWQGRHLHLPLTPSPTNSLEKCVQLIKGGSSYQIHKERGQKVEIWQEGFCDWTMRDANDWRNKVEYIRENPVRAALVEGAQDLLYSSAAGQFKLDPMPSKYLQTVSGAKAPFLPAQAPGLEPRPPKEKSVAESTTAQAKVVRVSHVGAGSPTPKEHSVLAKGQGV